jgi:hypothetical protein
VLTVFGVRPSGLQPNILVKEGDSSRVINRKQDAGWEISRALLAPMIWQQSASQLHAFVLHRKFGAEVSLSPSRDSKDTAGENSELEQSKRLLVKGLFTQIKLQRVR